MDRLSFSAQRTKDSRQLSFFCAFRGGVRDHIDNPSKPPFKFTSLLFVATARKNKFICSSLALIATLIREASLGTESVNLCKKLFCHIEISGEQNAHRRTIISCLFC